MGTERGGCNDRLTEHENNRQEALKEKENEKPEITASSEETIRLQTERDTYKTMYEQLLKPYFKAG